MRRASYDRVVLPMKMDLFSEILLEADARTLVHKFSEKGPDGKSRTVQLTRVTTAAGIAFGS